MHKPERYKICNTLTVTVSVAIVDGVIVTTAVARRVVVVKASVVTPMVDVTTLMNSGPADCIRVIGLVAPGKFLEQKLRAGPYWARTEAVATTGGRPQKEGRSKVL